MTVNNVVEDAPAKPKVRERVEDPVGYDPDRFLVQAKQVVVENYNKHRNPKFVPELKTDCVHIVWYVESSGNWQACVASKAVHGMLWDVSFSKETNVIELGIYKRLNFVKIPQEKVTA